MGTKELTFIGFMVIFISSCASLSPSNKPGTPREQVLFENFIFSICLGTAFNDTKVAVDTNKAANGYMQHGNMPIEAYEASRVVVDSWLDKEYLSKSGGQIQIMKCIDLFRSQDIKVLYEKYTPCTSSGGWLDQEDYVRQCKQN